MIGSDEFNLRGSQPARDSVGDISDTDFIETFIATRGGTRSEVGFLIDIVCPQPPSKRRHLSSTKNQTSSRKSGANRTERRR